MSQSPTQNLPASDRARIALFGGTFDPIHMGHIGMARLAVESLKLDRVIFLPCRLSPHKQAHPGADARQRMEMIRIATRDLPWAVLDDHDLEAPEPAYSYLTAESFHRRHPEARLFWLMGTDQWSALPRWREPGRLAERVEFIVITREGQPASAHESWRMHELVADFPYSATEIRSALSGDEAHPPGLGKEVAEYIASEGLYR